MDTSTLPRRTLLGALAVAPAAALPFVAAIARPADRGAWNAALARVAAAKRELAAHPFGAMLPGEPDYDRLEQEDEILVAADINAIDDLMRVPAPDHAAVIEKLEMFVVEFGDSAAEDYIRAAVADLRRLSALSTRG